MKRLLLLDSFGTFFKAYYAFINNPLTNSLGEETSVIFGFFNTLHKLLTEIEFDYFACVMDSKGKTFRHEIDPAYKANRPPAPEPLNEQVAYIIPLLEQLGVPVVSREGFEADDVIGTLASKASDAGIETVIMSSDKDLCQLINDKVSLVDIERGSNSFSFRKKEYVQKKFGVRPDQIIDYLSLVGDSSDNVPGVRGVGKKTAESLLTEHDTLDGIYKALEGIKSKSVKTKLTDDHDNALLSKKLVTIETDIKELPEIESLVFKPLEYDRALRALKDKQVNSIIRKYRLEEEKENAGLLDYLGSTAGKGKKANKKTAGPDLPIFKRSKYRVSELGELHTLLKKSKEIVFDLETTSLDPYACEIVSIVFVLPDMSSHYLSIKSSEYDDIDKALPLIKDIFEDDNIRKVGHNLKYEYSILKVKGIVLRNIHFDTMLAEFALNATRTHFNLENLIKDYFDYDKKTFKELLGKHESILDIPTAELMEYTWEDGEFTFLIKREQEKMPDNLKKIFTDIDMPLLCVLAEMELSGVLIDKPFLEKMSGEMTSEIESLTDRIHGLAGQEFNINSTKQLQEILFDKMGIKPIKKTKTGFSTDITVLEKLARNHPIAEELLRYRMLNKLKGTYIDSLPRLINPVTGRVHTNYHQTTAVTGRLSSMDPNLQNIPIKMKEGREIRKAFTAPKGSSVVSIDYSQVELRILAWLSKDKALLKAYTEDRDIHNQTACLLFSVKEDKVDDDMRRIAKTINFSVMYGISAFALAEDLKVSRQEAQSFIDAYFDNYSGVRKYIDNIIQQAGKDQYVETYYGRRRMVPDITSSNMHTKAHAERMAFNTVIQGTASDIIKIAMRRIQYGISEGHIQAELVMQVHDELVFYIKDKEINKNLPIITDAMKSIKPFHKILDVGVSKGKTWTH